MIRHCHILAVIAATVFLLNSCIDSREEVWLDPTGGGKARITVTIPSSVVTLRGGPSAVSAMIDDLLSPIETVHGLQKQITEGPKHTTVDFSFHFKSAMALSNALEDNAHKIKAAPAIRHLIGIASFRTEGIGFVAERKMDVAKALPGSRFLPARDGHYRLVTILHLPFAPSEHNATRTENNGRSLVWDMPLSTALRSPHVQRVKVAPPAPILAAGALITPAIIATLVFFWKRRRRTRASKQLGVNQQPVGPPPL